MIAFQYPPFHGSSAVQRTLYFSRHLPRYGWQPAVLTADPKAYRKTDQMQVGSISDIDVRRAKALDASRHLSIRGYAPMWFSIIDSWSTWALYAVPAGLRMIRKFEPTVIWSTFPTPTAHLIGFMLHRKTGIPWVADFRDPMTEGDYPQPQSRFRLHRWMEKRFVNACDTAVFTTPGARTLYAERYPHIAQDRWAVIPNGYDEHSFQHIESKLGATPDHDRFTLVHSGTVYPEERDPTSLYVAISSLKKKGLLNKDNFRLRLRKPGFDDFHHAKIKQHDIDDLVEIAPALPYVDALAEAMTADGLLVLQAADCNHQIPAKLYEYFRTGRPILGLTDPTGDTAALLTDSGVGHIAPLDSPAVIEDSLLSFVQTGKADEQQPAPPNLIRSYSREARTRELASLLDGIGSA